VRRRRTLAISASIRSGYRDGKSGIPPVPDAVRVNFSADGRFAFASLLPGTVVWSLLARLVVPLGHLAFLVVAMRGWVRMFKIRGVVCAFVFVLVVIANSVSDS
jgi:hypothetical protein